MKTSVCVDSNIWNTALKWKVFCFFFSFLFLKVLPGTFKLLSGKSRSLVYNRTRCFAFFPFLENVYLKVISLEKGRVFAATKRGGDNQSPALSEAKYYEKLFCFGHNFLFCFEILSAFWLQLIYSCFDKVIVLLNTQWPFISTSSVSRNAVKISHEKYFHTV